MSEDRVLSYLSGDMNDAERLAFEAELARDPSLQADLESWRLLAEARQLLHNEIGRDERDAALLRELQTLVQPAASATPEAPVHAPPRPAPSSPSWLRRAWQWLWPTPASPLLPVGWAFAVMLSVVVVLQRPTQDISQGAILTRGADTGCPRLVVDLPDTVTAKRLREVLAQYAVTVVDGPDADGRFILAAKRETSLRDAASALGALSSTPAPSDVCPK